MKIKLTLNALLCAMFTSFCISCRTQNNIPYAAFTKQVTNSDFYMNDSISDIIVNATKIKCYLTSQNPLDSVRTKDACTVPTSLSSVLSFLITDPSNFVANEIVYGMFSPSVRYEFEQTKGKKVMLDLDFGLKKMKVSNCQGENVITTDVPRTNGQLLRLTRMIFPEDITLKMLSENL